MPPDVPQAPVLPGAPAADESAAPWGSWTPPPASESTGPYGGPAGGSGGGSGREPVHGVRGQRYGSPRFAGRGVLAVFSILGLLLTLGIMAILGMKVLDGVSGSSSKDDATTGSVLAELTTTVPGSDPTAPTTAAPGAPGTGGPAGATSAASAAACKANARTIETAAEAYNAMNGSYPSDVQTLIDAGLLQPKGPLPFELHVQDGAVLVTGTGTCAGT
ncbi:MAG TPA: hypothetical protein PLS63_03975 [Microthrixaceae bacterium]|nr:hypothetical protein [Microthrixaceae bacterium]